MPDTESLFGFFVFALTAAITPGPSNVLVMSAGARSGLWGGLRCLLGVVAGMALLMGAAVFGLGGVITAFPGLLLVLRWTGSAFLLWLAWKIANAPPMGRDVHAEPIGFWKSLAFQWVNPKSWVVSASAAASYGSTLPGTAALRAALLAGTFALAATLACAVWLFFGAAFQRWLVQPRHARRFNRAMGLLLAASVAMLHA